MEQSNGENVSHGLIPPAHGQTDLLDRVTALLGDDVFFVPCEWGNEEAVGHIHVERPFEATKTEAYRAVDKSCPSLPRKDKHFWPCDKRKQRSYIEAD